MLRSGARKTLGWAMTSLILDRPECRVSIRIDVLPAINRQPYSKEVKLSAKQLEQMLLLELTNATSTALEAATQQT